MARKAAIRQSAGRYASGGRRAAPGLAGRGGGGKRQEQQRQGASIKRRGSGKTAGLSRGGRICYLHTFQNVPKRVYEKRVENIGPPCKVSDGLVTEERFCVKCEAWTS